MIPVFLKVLVITGLRQNKNMLCFLVTYYMKIFTLSQIILGELTIL